MNSLIVEPGRTRIGWVGTGVMGRWMCAHCIKAGFAATVYNRSMAKTKPLEELGARLADSPRAVAASSDIVFTMVGFPDDVRASILGPAGVLAGLQAGGVIVDMSTSEPSLAVAIWEAAKARGVASLDAPVSGGDVGAREARLSIMIGGEESVAKAVEPLFRAMGKTMAYMGSAGSGQHTKMVNQILIATNMIGVVEGLLYAHKAGLDLNHVIAAVGAGAAGSWSINNLGPRIVQRNFDPGFLVDHFVKDMGIALAEARRMQLCLPGLALAAQLYQAVQAQGHGKRGTHALMLAMEAMNRHEAR